MVYYNPLDETDKQKLENYSLEVSYGSRWINLNDNDNFIVHAESTPSRSKSYRQIKAQSPIVEGEVLLHAVPDMVTESVKVWVYGQSQVNLEDNLKTLEKLFEQFRYQVRVTKNEYREIWDCQMTDNIQVEVGQVSLHNMMALFSATVPRYPSTHREIAT